MARSMLVLCALPALTACGDGDMPPQVQESGTPGEQARVAGSNASEPLPGATMSPLAEPTGALDDGDGPVLEALGSDVEVELGPTLGGCSFTRQGETLLIAGARQDQIARGRGVVQIGGLERVLVGERTGGPGYINSGPTMTDGEFTVEVRRGAGGLAVGLDSTQWPADLAVRQGLGSKRLYRRGTWTCGV